MTFNDHDGSIKSYAYTREHQVPHAQLCPGNDALEKLMQQFR